MNRPFRWMLSGCCSIIPISVSEDPLESSVWTPRLRYFLSYSRIETYATSGECLVNKIPNVGRVQTTNIWPGADGRLESWIKFYQNTSSLIGFNFFFCGVDIFLRMINKFIFSQYVMHQPVSVCIKVMSLVKSICCNLVRKLSASVRDR